MPLVEYTVKIIVKQNEVPDLEEAYFDEVGVISVYRGNEFIQSETTDVEIINEEK